MMHEYHLTPEQVNGLSWSQIGFFMDALAAKENGNE